MAEKYIGKRVPRIDALEKVTGQAVYTADFELPGMLHASVCRSPHPHARIVSIDVSKARAMPGVRAVVTGQDLPKWFGPMVQDQSFLALEKVRYVGEPVAAVAAETEAQAQDAVKKILVEYESLPAVFDPCEAVGEDAPLIHENLHEYVCSPKFKIVPHTNICTKLEYSRGDVETAFAEADEIFEDEYTSHPVSHSPMEPHAAVAMYNAAQGQYTFWSSTDGPHRRAGELSKALGIPLSKIRFVSPYSGGGFGGKGALVTEAILTVLVRKTNGRPVKLVFTRDEVLAASQTRVGAWIRLKTGVKKDGSIIARKAYMIWDSGAYASKAPEVAARGALTVVGPYKTHHLELTSVLVYTNKQVSGAYRGFGTTQVTWACEVQMDQIAERLGIDPVKIRLINGLRDGDPYINGQVMNHVGLIETVEKAAAEIGWDSPKPSPADGKIRGRGIATMIKGTNTPTDSFCILRVDQDAGVSLLASVVEIGAGQKTVLAQVAAEELGFPIESITVVQPDTYVTPYDFGQTSSRSTFHAGNAVRLAGINLRGQILKKAAEVYQTDVANLKIEDAQIVRIDTGEKTDFRDFMRKIFGPRGGNFLAEGHYSPAGSPMLKADPGKEQMSSAFWMFVTHAAEVEVDTETGVVSVIKVAAAHDLGRAINPVTCEQQIEGAAIMGISNTLFEEFKFQNGRILNDSLADYKIATVKDTPEIVSILVEDGHSEGPYGAKGVGEPAAAATAPAIGNAIYDAIGIRLMDLPITPEKVLAAIKAKANQDLGL